MNNWDSQNQARRFEGDAFAQSHLISPKQRLRQPQRCDHHIDDFDSDERRNETSDTGDQQVPP